MRLRLVLITALLASLIGTGGSIAIILALFSSLRYLKAPGAMIFLTLLLPVAAVFLGAFFVYRHTARRRKLQAFLTALLATFLSLCFFLLASILTARYEQIQPPQPTGPSASN